MSAPRLSGAAPPWYARPASSRKLRIHVTVDDELASAMARVDPAPASKAAPVRDLALREAQALEEERARRAEAIKVLLQIADGTLDYDFEAAKELYERRGEHLT